MQRASDSPIGLSRRSTSALSMLVLVMPAEVRRNLVAWAARIASVREAQLEDSGSGLTPVTQGWFVVNVRDAEWWFSERRGARCAFESEYGDPRRLRTTSETRCARATSVRRAVPSSRDQAPHP